MCQMTHLKLRIHPQVETFACREAVSGPKHHLVKKREKSEEQSRREKIDQTLGRDSSLIMSTIIFLSVPYMYILFIFTPFPIRNTLWKETEQHNQI